jgi:polyribonucleotide nucleotidyltransferase
MDMIHGIVTLPEVGEVYHGKVVSILAFGAFVEILPGKEGLLHISEISWKRLSTVEEELQVGQTVDVKLIEIDEKTGKYRLSRKVLLEKPEGYVEQPENRGHRGPGGSRDGHGNRDGRDRRDRGDRNDRSNRGPRGGYDRR